MSEAKTIMRDGEYTVSYGDMTCTGNAASLAGQLGYMMVKLSEAQADNARLQRSLREIIESKYCDYQNTGPTDYGKGVTDGHRYCADIAKRALKEQPHD